MARTKKLKLAQSVTTNSPIFSGVVNATSADYATAAGSAGTAYSSQISLQANVATTVTTNADLTGVVTSIGNETFLSDTTVTPGAYTKANITVSPDGRITLASSGTDPDLSVYVLKTNTAPLNITTDDLSILCDGDVTFESEATMYLYSVGDLDIESIAAIEVLAVGGDISLRSSNRTEIQSTTGNNSLGVFAVINAAASDVFTVNGLGNVVASGTIAGSNLSGTNTGDQDLSGKASISTSALAISYAGLWLHEYPFIITNAQNVEISGVIETYSGKWIDSFVYGESTSAPRKLTSLTFTDLEGITGNCQPQSMPSTTTLSFPALKVIGGSFNPIGFALVTTLNVSQLRVVGGALAPQSFSALTTLTFNNLRNVGGNCNPSIMGLLTSLNFPELLSVGGNFAPNNMSSLLALTFPKLKYVKGGFVLTGYATFGGMTTLSGPELESIGAELNIFAVTPLMTADYPLLTRVGAGFTLTGTGTNMTSSNMNSLISVGANFLHSNTGKVAISYPALTSITGQFSVAFNNSATSLSFPVLTTIGSGVFSACALVTSLNLNSLVTCLGSFTMAYAGITTFSLAVLNNISGNLNLVGCNALTTINLSAMANYRGTITITTITGLTTVTLGVIGVLKLIQGATVNFSACALNQASVDGILALLVSLNGTGGTTLFGSGKTVTLNGGTNSAPSTAGAANRTILVGRGATVLVN